MHRRALIAAAAILVVAAATTLSLVLLNHDAHVASHTTRLPSIGAEVFDVDISALVQRGPPVMTVVRFDRPAEFVPHHFAKEGFDAPQPISKWSERLAAPIVFNAGQFDDSLTHLGWLKANGKWIVEHRHPKFMGLLVSGPLDGGAWAGVIDLQQSNPDVINYYRHAIQSMMLVDDRSRPRVRQSEHAACRTVVAQDRIGRTLIMVTKGAVRLADLAHWLPDSGLNIVRAMNLDGGIEAQLAIDTPELQLVQYGQYGTGTTVFQAGPGEIRYPLPAVIEVRAQ